MAGLGLPQATVQLWVRESDSLPMRVWYQAKGTDLEVELVKPRFEDPWPEAKWKLEPHDGENVQTVARAHLTRFFDVMRQSIGEKIPTLGPATGERKVLAREGNGRLERINGTRVLILKGSPEEMGHQHGVLMRKEIHNLADRILYGVGVGELVRERTLVLRRDRGGPEPPQQVHG